MRRATSRIDSAPAPFASTISAAARKASSFSSSRLCSLRRPMFRPVVERAVYVGIEQCSIICLDGAVLIEQCSIQEGRRMSEIRKKPLVFALLAGCCLAVGGCALMWEDHSSHSTTPLVQFLYGDAQVPPQDAQVELRLPIRVGLSFLPSSYAGSGAIPTVAQRQQVLESVREKFRSLPYVTEIVIIPDYYLDGRRKDGLAQMQQLARLYSLDLFALASYDIT